MKSKKWIREELESLEHLLDIHPDVMLKWKISYTIRMLKRILED